MVPEIARRGDGIFDQERAEHRLGGVDECDAACAVARVERAHADAVERDGAVLGRSAPPIARSSLVLPMLLGLMTR